MIIDMSKWKEVPSIKILKDIIIEREKDYKIELEINFYKDKDYDNECCFRALRRSQSLLYLKELCVIHNLILHEGNGIALIEEKYIVSLKKSEMENN